MSTNRAYLIGNLAAEAKFEVLNNNILCGRFMVVVPRSNDQVSAKYVHYLGGDGRLDKSQIPSELKAELKDQLQVACYGPRAQAITGALPVGARLAVEGWHEERRFYDREMGRYRVVHEINAANIVIARESCGSASAANRAHLIGVLEKEPQFEVLRGSVPCLRLKVRVPRGPRQVSADLAPYTLDNGLVDRAALPRELRRRLSDSLAVVIYGQRALLYSKYLRQHAQVAVDGWSEERRYYDRDVKRERRVQEINATHLVCGPGSDFDAGEAYRRRMISEAAERGPIWLEAFGLPPVEMSSADLEG